MPGRPLTTDRRQARAIAAHHPVAARELRIGRPDLPRHLDDGGLIDLNDAPVERLARLPGVSPQHAAMIAADRSSRGRFRTVDQLVGRGLFPAPLPAAVAELLLIVDVQDSVGGARQDS